MSNLDEKAVKKITVNGAGIILDAAKRKAVPMTVKNALGFVRKNDAKYPTVSLIGIIGGNSVGTSTITAPALAVIEEFGTVERTRKDGSSTGYIKARPFMRPALDENKDKVNEIIVDGLERIILKQGKKNKLI